MPEADLTHDEALAQAADATTRLVIAVRRWEQSLDALAEVTRRERAASRG